MDSILQQKSDYSFERMEALLLAKSLVKQQRCERATQAAEDLKQHLSSAGKRMLELASEKAGSNWLTSLPIEEFGFSLHKGAFVDALSLRYGWPPPGTPMFCVCGERFSIQHAFSCPSGGLIPIHYFFLFCHNKLRDVTANLLTEVCHDVMVEPYLQPLTNKIVIYSQ